MSKVKEFLGRICINLERLFDLNNKITVTVSYFWNKSQGSLISSFLSIKMTYFLNSKIKYLLGKLNQIAHSKFFTQMKMGSIIENSKSILKNKASHIRSLAFILTNKTAKENRSIAQ